MPEVPWIIIVLGILILLPAVVAFWSRKKLPRRPPDYYTFFILGIIWLPAGIATGNSALFAMGLIFMALGITHKKDWKKNRVNWSDLTAEEKNFRKILVIVLLVLVALGFLAFLMSG